jgi:hypothetical protein
MIGDKMTFNKQEWRKKNPKKRNEERKKNYSQTNINCPNATKKWELFEEILVLKRDKTDRELHIALGRSVQAIQVKRSKLKAKK